MCSLAVEWQSPKSNQADLKVGLLTTSLASGPDHDNGDGV